MKCKVCGAESGKYALCRVCNEKKEQGLIIKCSVCDQWHYKNSSCPQPTVISGDKFLYEPQKTLISKSEQSFFDAIKACLPEGYYVFPQVNLAAFINRTDDSRYHNELFRNIDFLITDNEYAPKIAVEINDQSHLSNDRRERDEKVKNILEEAGIPIMKLWTSYGVNSEYIKGKITNILNSPVVRNHHFVQQPAVSQQPVYTAPKKKQGCYIATCVYGSYDCPQVWTLRRYRDYGLSSHWLGRLFIKFYYAVSPTIVKYFGNFNTFHILCKKILDKKVQRLNANGYDDFPYKDNNCLS